MFRSMALGLVVALGLFASRQAEATILDVSGEFDFDFSTGLANSSNVSVGGILLPVIYGSKIEGASFSIWILDKNYEEQTRSAI